MGEIKLEQEMLQCRPANLYQQDTFALDLEHHQCLPCHDIQESSLQLVFNQHIS